ncbi:SMP-30/gluconolactonase/LRE family protein [Sphingopyxis sp.]|jgi:sugar lactone lactonase YvrE|uniref:SMP-30/gluconolactonase/LRE family protein n=1 Tax=Sphingopyxis sp. TaxID=1908224 RepID=UPI003F713BA3
MHLYDERVCQLGESPLWHPERGQLFWTDILANRLLARKGKMASSWTFDAPVSAIGIIDESRLVAADSGEIFTFDIETGRRVQLHLLEAEIETNRSNDGRVDPWGGFWIGTMELEGAPGRGSIYRWHAGELRAIVNGLAIPNGLCFDQRRGFGYYTDTLTHKLFRLPLGADGWPIDEASVFVDLGKDGGLIDGAVTDRDGNIHLALWDRGEVMTFDPGGRKIDTLDVGVPQATCPMFGDADFRSLFVTTASVGIAAAHPGAGKLYRVDSRFQGTPEPRLRLSQ